MDEKLFEVVQSVPLIKLKQNVLPILKRIKENKVFQKKSSHHFSRLYYPKDWSRALKFGDGVAHGVLWPAKLFLRLVR